MTAPGQLRRHARRMRRYGMQPMIIMGNGDRMPDTAAVIIARCIWRYRSELGPGACIALLFLAGLLLHTAHPAWWPYAILTAISTSTVVITLGERLGLPTRAERLYAATGAISAGCWLAAAIVTGATRTPLPGALAVGGLVMSVPWWAHGRRRARVRVERKLEAWPVIAQAVGLAGSRVMEAVVDLWGWHARFGLARGQTIDDVRAKLAAIESGLGTFRGAARVYPTMDNLANRFELRVLDKDPHADAIVWPGPSVTTITEPIDLGPFEDASPATVLLLRRHGLIGGTTGSGKSGCVNVLMGNLTACKDAIIWAIDLKQGMELQPWADCIERLATTPTEARALLRDAAAVVQARAGYLTASGLRTWQPTAQMPALVVVIDEYAELADTIPDSLVHADSVARLGRAVAVTLIAATQRPTQQAMGQRAIRSQMDVRIAFRVREKGDADLILGRGMRAAGWHADTLNAPGKFLISAPEHDVPRRARAYLLTDEIVDTTAAAHADSRPSLDDISASALSPSDLGSERGTAPDAPGHTHSIDTAHGGDGTPESMLWAALSLAPDTGTSVADLINATGMSRPWVYLRLRELTSRHQAIQVSRGFWKATGEHES
jgi:FtsK/SpoIIIE family